VLHRRWRRCGTLRVNLGTRASGFKPTPIQHVHSIVIRKKRSCASLERPRAVAGKCSQSVLAYSLLIGGDFIVIATEGKLVHHKYTKLIIGGRVHEVYETFGNSAGSCVCAVVLACRRGKDDQFNPVFVVSGFCG
jgi:hypothetical protein